jgi:hypothetical protein
MEIVVGLVLAVGVGLGATWVGFDRDRALYPAITVVVASYYALFAILGGSQHALILECVVAAAFIAASVAGFRTSLWIVVLALAGHGVFDLVHGRFIDNPGLPTWWPAFCASYDVAAAGYLAWLLLRRRVPAHAV